MTIPSICPHCRRRTAQVQCKILETTDLKGRIEGLGISPSSIGELPPSVGASFEEKGHAENARIGSSNHPRFAFAEGFWGSWHAYRVATTLHFSRQYQTDMVVTTWW